MRRASATLLMLFCFANAQARSLGYALKAAENVTVETRQVQAMPGLVRWEMPAGLNKQHFGRPEARHQKPAAYDITRETGAYFFDTVYKFRIPATKRIHIGLNGGYTFYDRYLHGFAKGASSLGLVGGVTLTFLRPAKAGSPVKKSFLRLNADLISYPYRYKSTGKDAYDLSRYTRDLSARVYVDARITKRGFTTRCMLGVAASGTEQQSSPLFVGVAVGYRFP